MANDAPSDTGQPPRPSGLDRFLSELKRRRVYRVGAAYVVVAFGLLEGLDIILPALAAPAWILTAAVIVVLLAFPVSLVLAWIFDLGPGGLQRTADLPENATPEIQRWARLAAAGVIVGAVGAVGWWWLRPTLLAGTVAAGADVIAVVPFSASGPGTESLGEGMVDLLSTNLDEVGAIRTIDSRSVLRAWAEQGKDGPVDRVGALGVAEAVGAGSVLLGSLVATGSEVQMDAQLWAVDSTELASARIRGPANQMLALVDSLTIGLVREIWRSREPLPSFRVAAVTTGSLDAIRQHLEAERWYRRSQWDSAVVHYRAAVQEDSAFALAHHRLASSYGWLDLLGSATARHHAERAYELRERLPDRERSMVVADYLFHEGDDLQALDSALAFVGRSPDDAEGWFRVADYQYHSGLRWHLSLDELIEPFDRVLDLDPTLTPALFHPIDLAMSAADSVLFNEYLDKVHEYSTVEAAEPLELSARVVWTTVSPDSLPGLLDRIYAARPGSFQAITSAVYRSDVADPVAYLAALRSFLGDFPDGSPERAVLPQIEVGLLTSTGRYDEARPSMEVLFGSGAGPTQFLMYPVMAGLADTTVLGEASVAEAIPARWEPGRAALWTALVELGAGNPEAARNAVDRWVSDVPEGSDPLTDAYRRAVLDWISFEEDGVAQDATDLRSAVESLFLLAPQGDLSLLELLRLRSHEAMASTTEHREEAIALMGRFVARDLHVEVAQRLVLAEALEAAGRPSESAAQYRRFLEIMRAADVSAARAVDRARDGLRRVGLTLPARPE